VFDLQDQITERVVGIVEPSLQRQEIERSRRKHPANLEAYDYYLRALPRMASQMPAEARIASGFLEDALKLDPNYAAAHALIALCRQIAYLQGGLRSARDEADKIDGLRHARAALETSADDATALAVTAFVLANLGRDSAAASSAIERALSLNPSSAAALYFGAAIHSLNGDAAIANAYAQRALRLSPFDPQAFNAHWALGNIAMLEASFDEAASHYGKGAQANARSPSLHVVHAVALALAGRMEEAKPILLRALELGPGVRISGFQAFGMKQALLDRLVEGARLLGLPE
jgi:adenylate cyclase